MRVLIDTYPLLVRSAGVKNYLYHWVEALRRTAPQGSIGALPQVGNGAELDHDRSMAGMFATVSGLATLALSNHLRLPILERLANTADIFHVSSLVRNPPCRPRLTATVHDLTAWMMPELHLKAHRQADSQLAANLRRAQRIIAVSEATRQDAIRLLQIPPERIVTIHSGVASSFFNVSAERVAAVRTRYQLKRPFILSVGTIEPRKNLSALVNAYRALPASMQDEFELVLAGTDRMGGPRDHDARPSGPLSGLRAGARYCAPYRGRHGFRLSLALRRLRISGGAGDGGGSPGHHVERVGAAGDRGGRGAAGGSAQPD